MVNGERAEFHSPRHTFAALLGKSAPVKLVRELIRHSTPTLTIGRHMHTNLTERAGAVERMALPRVEPRAEHPRQHPQAIRLHDGEP